MLEAGSGSGDFGDLLLRYRVTAGLSREALAERAGLSATGIGALERGQRRAPHADTVRRLSEALQLSPDDAATLAAAVVRHRAPQAQPAAAPLSVTNSATLIAQQAAIVGRGWDVAVVSGLLRAEDTRLVTLTGPAGVGKTALALAVAEHLAREMPEPVLMVDLAPVRDPKLVLQTVLARLGLREDGDRALERLAQELRKRRTLILLDNFEQVIPAAHDLPWLLAEAPELRLLVTSRSPLGLMSEYVYLVAPLELPDLHHLPAPGELAEIPAVSLFITRAQAVSPTFELTDENSAAVAELCVRLDGLPLAIKLAAARMHLLSPQMVLDRLEHRLSLLRSDALDLPERQQTLEAAIAWSYDLLGPQEQALFRRMAVFAGGFTIEAAEEVMAALDGTKTDVLHALEALSSLVDASLVRVQAEPPGPHRYGMLESIREYALDRLAASGELEAASRAHATYFIQLIEQDESRHHESAEHTWLHLQQDEVQNLYAARQWLTAHPDPELELRLATAPGIYWILEGDLESRRFRLEASLAKITDAELSEEPRVLLKARITLGDTLTLLGDLDHGCEVLNESLERARALGDEPSIAVCLISLGWCHALRGDSEAATRLLEEGLALAGATGDELQVGRAQLFLGEIARMLGQPERSITWLENALSGFRAVGELALTAAALTDLALARAQTEGVAAAAAHLREGLGISGHMRNPWLVNLTGERTALVGSESAENELLAEALGALDGLKRRQGVRGMQERAEQERLQALISELEGRLGYAAFYEMWRRGNRHSLEETIGVIDRVIDSLSTAAPATASRPSGEAEGSSPVAGDAIAAETNDVLTEREREVLALAAEGLANREIAGRMGIAERTVKQHLTAAFRKLGVSSREEAVSVARRTGIV